MTGDEIRAAAGRMLADPQAYHVDMLAKMEARNNAVFCLLVSRGVFTMSEFNDVLAEVEARQLQVQDQADKIFEEKSESYRAAKKARRPPIPPMGRG